MNYRVRGLAIFWFLLVATRAWAIAWPVADLAVLADPAGSETIESVSDSRRTTDFIPAPQGLTAGYTRTVHWLRFRLDAPPANESLLLEVLPPYLDDLQLFIPDGRGGFELRRSGDTHPFSSRDVPARGFVFRLIFNDAAPQTFYLRVATTSTSLVSLRVWESAAFIEAQGAEYLLLGLYYGLLAAMLIFNLWHGYWRHDPEHRAFLIYAFSVFLFMAAVNGLIAQYLAPEHPGIGHYGLSALVMMTTGAAAHFHRLILVIDRRMPLLYAYFQGVLGLSVLGLVGLFAGYFTEAARVLTLAALLFPVFGLARTVVLWRQGQVGSHYLALAYSVGLLSYLLTVLSVQGWLPGSHWQIYSFQLGTLLALTAFNFGLFERLRYIQQERDVALNEARQARAERDAQALARRHQGALLAMLTHELKTPLSVIRLRLGTPQASARMQTHAEEAVTEIDGIVERCALSTQLDEDAVLTRPADCDLIELVGTRIAGQSGAGRIICNTPSGFSGALHTDPALLAILIDNLLDNALKYSPSASPVQVELREQARDGVAGVLFAVANAPGAAGRPDATTVFEKYYRAPAAHGQSGSGLGLYIARTLATILGARLDYLANQPDIRFELWLPRAIS